MDEYVITLDMSTWSRLTEVEEFAKENGVDLGTAIRILTNKGLSHLNQKEN